MIKKLVCIISFTIIMHSCSIFQNTKTITQDIDSSVIESKDVLQKFLGTYEFQFVMRLYPFHVIIQCNQY